MNATLTNEKAASAGAATDECFIIVPPEGQGGFSEQLAATFAAYAAERERLGLDLASAVAVTVFLSDSANQEGGLRYAPAFRALLTAGAAVSVVQQPPIGGKIGLFAYHTVRRGMPETRSPLMPEGVKPWAAGLDIRTPGYRFVHFAHLLSADGGSAREQATRLFGTPGEGLRSAGLDMPDIIRTWLYVAYLDIHYRQVATARNEAFLAAGISEETGFPASTGIEGRSSEAGDFLLMNAFAIQGLRPGQNRRIKCLTHLNNTVDYGITFERGRLLTYGDRRHAYISGTASINNTGTVLHPGDVVRQTGRAVENVRALLATVAMALTDLRYVLVYLRDVADAATVAAVLDENGLGGVPRLLLHAPVCRPGWLVELEGVATDGNGDPNYPPF